MMWCRFQEYRKRLETAASMQEVCLPSAFSRFSCVWYLSRCCAIARS